MHDVRRYINGQNKLWKHVSEWKEGVDTDE